MRNDRGLRHRLGLGLGESRRNLDRAVMYKYDVRVGIGRRYGYLCPMVVFFFFYSPYSRRPTMTIKAEGRTGGGERFHRRRDRITHTHTRTHDDTALTPSLLREETLTLRVPI